MFDPNTVTVKNGNFMGLPIDEENANLILLPVPWDVTTSFKDGTSTASQNILEASYQLDFANPYSPDAWKKGIFMPQVNQEIGKLNNASRKKAIEYIEFLESGGELSQSTEMAEKLSSINAACEEMKQFVFDQTLKYLNKGKLIGLIGGDHSVPLGYLEALTTVHNSFGILTIDAHMDLRHAYEGFTYSHASIFKNALDIPQLSSIVQVGIRDWCEEEEELVSNSRDKVRVYYDHQIKGRMYEGQSFKDICQDIISALPKKVYISFDIDGLDPKLCPETGTPVPGGLELSQTNYLIQQIIQSGRQLIGFDLCEVAGLGNEWDGNVGARVLYNLSSFLLHQSK
ncbi:MAG: agmatinase family protein [Bacteroidia bacterium]|nr:agmatinase family protein [Bacteroidia bacterium]